jgi:hypothetical protein
MGSAFYRGLYMFFAVGAAISFLPTILLAWDMDSLAWQISIGAMLTNAGIVILLALLEGLYQSSKNYGPATMLTFFGLTAGLFAGLFFADAINELWYYLLIPGIPLLISSVMSGLQKEQASH